MRRFHLLFFLLLVACQQTTVIPDAPQAPLPLGFVEINFSNDVGAQALISDGLRFSNPSTSFEALNGACYLSTSFNVTNSTGTTLNNLSLVAISRANSVAGTAISNLRSAAGNPVTDEAIYRSIRPSHRVVNVSGQPQVVEGAADFQVFLPAEVASIQQDVSAVASDAVVLEYGFVARNQAGRRILANNETGSITIAVQYPCATSIAGGTPFSFTMTFAFVDVQTPRFTRGPNESVAALEQRIINAYGATMIPANLEILLVGNDNDTPVIGNLIRVGSFATFTTQTPTPAPDPDPAPDPTASSSFNSGTPKFTPSSSAADIINSGATKVSVGGNDIYIGTWQKTGSNQNPIIASIDPNTNAINWVRSDYEDTPVDGRGNGLLVTASGELYAAMSVDGGSNSFNFAAGSGWLNSYGMGGGAKVGVIVKIDPTTGTPQAGTFVTAVLSSGNTNTLNINNLGVDTSGNIIVSANTAAAPRFADTSRMPCPAYDGNIEDYTLVLAANLQSAVSATAPSCGNP